MDNTHDGGAELPPPKRIKLEEEVTLGSLKANFPSASSATTTTVSRRGRKPKKTNEEKARELLQDERLSAVEPQQVLCRMCGHWIKLFRHTDFAKANWLAHAERCSVKTQWIRRVKREPEDTFSLTVSVAPADTTLQLAPAQPPEASTSRTEIAPPPPESVSANAQHRVPGRSLEERIAALTNDTRVAKYDAHSVECRLCQARVRLHNMREYDLQNWNRHVEACERKGLSGNAAGVVGSGSAPATESLPPLRIPKPCNPRAAPAPVTAPIPSKFPTPAPVPISAPIKTEPSLGVDTLYSYTPALKKKKGRNIAERIEGLRQDPRCGEVQPHQVFCLMCNRWIKLYREVEYIDSNWLRHAERCSIRMSNEAKLGNKPNGESSKPSTATKATSNVPKEIKIDSETGLPQKSIQQREALLRTDPLIKQVEPRRVQCKMCDEWVQLNANNDFDPCNWQLHLPLCSNRVAPKLISQALPPPIKVDPVKSAPSISAPVKVRDTRTYEERRQELMDDERCEQVEAHRVFCRICESFIGLHAKKDYSTSNWFKHVTSCEKKSKKRKRGAPVPAAEKPILPLMTTQALQSSSSTPGASSSGPQMPLSTPGPTTAPNFAQQPLVVPGFPLLIGVPSSAMTAPSAIVPPMLPLSALVAPTPSASSSELLSGPSPNGTSDPVQRAIAHAVLQISNSNPVPESRALVEDRKQRFLKDERVGEVEPHRVLCKLCQKWLKLSNDVEYATYNWYKHIKRCDEKTDELSSETPAPQEQPSEPAPVIPSASPTPVVVKEEPVPDLFTREPLLGRRTTAAERLARLQKDTRIKTLEAHRAECGLCGKWIKLQNKTEYDPHNWTTHITKCAIRKNYVLGEVNNDESGERCPPANANDVFFRAKMESRIAEYLDDPRCAVAEPKRALCNLCKQWIKLRDDQQYSLVNWHKHIERCEKHLHAPGGDGAAREVVERLQRQQRQPQQTTSVVVKTEATDTPIISGRQRRTEADREAELRADPRLAAVEPGRVYCKMCSSWIKLNAATGYLPSNWHRHSERCERKRGGWNGDSSVNAGAGFKKPALGKGKEIAFNPQFTSSEVIDLVDDGNGVFGAVELGHLVDAFEPTVSSTEFIVPEVSSSGISGRSFVSLQLSSRMAQSRPVKTSREDAVSKRGHRSTAFRKAELEADPRTGVVESGRIKCGMCDKWIQTRQDVAFSGQNWLKHAGICERRSGWLARGAKAVSSSSKGMSVSTNAPSKVVGPEPPVPVVADVEMQCEPDLPYNARLSAIHERSHAPFGGADAALPSFKPVDWSQQVVYYDGEDDDESDMEDNDCTPSTSANIVIVNEASTSPMDVDLPLSSADALMDEVQDRPRPLSESDATKKKKNLSVDLSLSPTTFTKAKLSLVESASPSQLRASHSPVNALTILSHPPPRAGLGMTMDSPTAGFIVPISI